VAKMFAKAMNIFERIGTARAAHHLATMGRYDEARKLMTEFKKNDY